MRQTSGHLPSLEALRAGSERVLANELRLVATRQQVAVIRTLVDELERTVARGTNTPALEQQLVEELARVGCRSLATAASICDGLADGGQVSDILRVPPQVATKA